MHSVISKVYFSVVNRLYRCRHNDYFEEFAREIVIIRKLTDHDDNKVTKKSSKTRSVATGTWVLCVEVATQTEPVLILNIQLH